MVHVIFTASKSRVPNTFRLLPFALLFLAVGTSVAQEPVHWRVWKDVEELRGWDIRFSASGRAWTWYETAAGAASGWFDGYAVGSLPPIAPDYRAAAVIEGRLGQIWALDIDMHLSQVVGIGRYVYERDISKGEWIRYPHQEIDFFEPPNRAAPALMSYLPGANECVLLLTPDGLLEFDAATKQTSFLKKVEESDLGRFIHITASLDGGAWVTAERGLAKATGDHAGGMPMAGSVQWQEYAFPPELGLRDLAMPVEIKQGEVFATASQTGKQRRILVRFDGENCGKSSNTAVKKT
ncbi:MAG: hypothetical protein ABIH23_30160 [bacterium]